METEQLIKLWLLWWRDIIMLKCQCKQAMTNQDFGSTAEEWRQAFTLEELKSFVDDLLRALNQISKNINTRLILEILMLNMPLIKES